MSEPDYRAMWGELRERLSAAEERWFALCERGAGDPNNAAFRRARWDTFGTVAGWMDEAKRARTPDPGHTPAVRRVVAWETWHRLDEPYASVDDAYFDAAHGLLNKARIHKGASYESYMRHWPPDRVLKLAAALRHRDEKAGHR